MVHKNGHYSSPKRKEGIMMNHHMDTLYYLHQKLTILASGRHGLLPKMEYQGSVSHSLISLLVTVIGK